MARENICFKLGIITLLKACVSKCEIKNMMKMAESFKERNIHFVSLVKLAAKWAVLFALRQRVDSCVI